MPKEFSRTLRVADQIQRELADLIDREIKDPRIIKITLTSVEVDRDYAHAKVFYTSLGSKEENILIEKGLERASGFLRMQLSHRMKLRSVPQLHFIYDKSIEHGIYMTRLIEEAITQEKQ